MPTVLITGGHGGIGLECSKHLAAHYRTGLLLAGRNLERVEPVAREPGEELRHQGEYP